MKKIFYLLIFLFFANTIQAQVGINTTIPNAQLDIRSSSQATPTNTDGILIPKVDAFPATNPTAAQQGMLLYLTTTSGTDLPGFYYWDNVTVDWIPITGTSVGTLDQAYDFGGAGNGKTITADAGAVLINGTDGLVSTGTFGVGATVPSIVGARLMWNPRKLAFRVGWATNEWDDINTGINSVSFGSSNYASGHTSTAFGTSNQALGVNSFAVGRNTITSGWFSTVFGRDTESKSYGEVVFGIGNTDYSITTNGDSQFGITNATDRLFVIGNAIDVNNNANVDNSERSDAMIVLKNGLTRLPSTTNTMIDAADGKAIVTKEYMQSNNWSLIGNTGTNPTTNFIGTTDNVDLVFKRGNALSGRIGNSTTFFGRLSGSISTGANNTYIGTEAGRDNVTGQQNVFIGRRSGTFGATGSDNILIGNGAGIFNEANQNSFVGSFSGNGTSTGANNTFMGYSSGSGNGTGSQNAFFGASAGNANTTGVGNTTVGTNSDVGANNLSNATAIGFNSMVDASNSLVLGSVSGINSATSSVNVGIGTTTPLDRLHVVGNIRMVDGNQAVGRILTSNANGTASWTNPIGTTNGTLDQAYDFGGAGNGKTITADAGAVTIDGTDGLVSNGIYGTGLVAPSGNGAKMYWNPRKAAFRAGFIFSNDWDDSNIGEYSVAFNLGTRSTGRASFSTGGYNFALANFAQVAGYQNTSFSYGETVLGIGATFYTSSVNGTTQFSTANAADRLFVIGNAIDANNNTVVDIAERSDAMVVLKNGNTGLGTSTPLNRLHVVGNIRMEDGNQAVGRVLTSDANGVATWQNASANAWGLLGNAGTNATTNFIGTTDNVDLVFRRGNIISGRLGDSNTFFGRNSGVVNAGTSNTFIGERAGIANASGSSNTFLGRLAGANGTSGNDNTYLGYAAGLNNTGNSNLILGSFASQNTSGNFNVFLGSNAGSNNTTGARNTIIGFQSDVGAANLTNATAIGNLAQVDTSNSLVLGSINGVNGSLVSTNVGIGTTSPLTRLDVVDENTITANLIYGNLNVRSNNAQNIDVGGAITLGGYNDDTMLQPRVFGSVEGRKSNATTNSSSGYLIFKTNNAGTLAERVRITNTGNVGVGIPNPLGLFELALDQGRKPGTNTWTIVSDQRLKTINGNYTKGLNEILQLNPIRFNYKNVGERTFDKEVLDTEFPGFIAQEVQPLFPDAVGTDADGFLNFNIHPILIASVNAIKELNAKNESLQTENESLKTELNEQKVLLESVLQRLALLEQK